jgi:polyphosphate glucokinase
MTVSTAGEPLSERFRLETPQPATPTAVLEVVEELAGNFLGGGSRSEFDYVACGFPGVVKEGVIFTAHNLAPEWAGFDLQKALAKRLGVPARVANDAAVQGMGAVKGKGVELCVTLGTGLGSSLFVGGVLVPGLELGHHPLRDNKTYEDFIGRTGLKKLGKKKWNKRVREALATAEHLFNYDHVFIGGGNNKLIKFELPANATLVENLDGLRGGAALWRDVVQARQTLVRTKP